MRWVLVYADGSVHTDVTTPPELVPESGAVVLATEDEDRGRLILPRRDCYWLEPGGWWGGKEPPGDATKLVLGAGLTVKQADPMVDLAATHPHLPPRQSRR